MSLILVASAILRCSICLYASLSQNSTCHTIGKISSGFRFVISTGEYCLVSVACVPCASAGSAHKPVNMAEDETMAMQKCLAERVPAPFQPPKIAEVFSPSLLWRSNWRNWLPSFSFQTIGFSFVFFEPCPFRVAGFVRVRSCPFSVCGSDVFFTLCLSMGDSHANLPIYPYTA